MSSSSTSTSSPSPPTVIAVLLPLTSRGQQDRSSALDTLREFESCLQAPDRCVLMIGVDTDDALYAGEGGRALFQEAFPNHSAAGRVHVHEFKPSRPAKICHIATALAGSAYQLKEVHCDYFVLLGDDVRIEPKRAWLDLVVQEFTKIQFRTQERFGIDITVPHGFGVVALPDTTFPSFPTFPVVGRCHLDIFNRQLFPPAFINQDADPYVWEIYRPFAARSFADGVRLTNKIGGDEMNNNCRYEREHIDWKYDVLNTGVSTIEEFLAQQIESESLAASKASVSSKMSITLDVITPTYRGTSDILRRIISLTAPDRCDVRFIVIVDNPAYTHLRAELEQLFPGGRVLVRVNSVNIGASGSRNRGLEESTGKWNLFLDDDIVPDPWIIHRYVEAIRKKGERACGFVGLSNLPAHSNYLTAGLTMSYLTYFWGTAAMETGGECCPWAVTANVLARRGRSARFDLAFLRTGGGEDIAYLRELMKETGLPLLKAPLASITHPWWDGGFPNPIHYFRWGRSDHLLMDEGRYPEYSYVSWPHVIEWSMIIIAVALSGLFVADASNVCRLLVCALCALWCTEVGLDIWRCMVSDTSVAGDVVGWRRVVCAIIACMYKNFCECGHTWSWICRAAPWLFGRRFDWWFGLDPLFIPSTRDRERNNSCFFLASVLISAMMSDLQSYLLIALTLVFAAIAIGCFVFPSSNNPAQQLQQSVLQKPLDSATDNELVLRIALTFDDAYAAPAAVVIASLIEHHPKPARLEIAVIDCGITNDSWAKLSSMVDKCSASVVLDRIHTTADSEGILTRLSEYPSIVRDKWTIFSRLWLDELLPADWTHVLYLDCDVLIRGSLGTLWHQLVSKTCSAPLLAVRDFGIPFGEPGLAKFGWTADDQYFNAGMLALDLSHLRSSGLGRALRSFTREFAGDAALPHHDQCILNIILWGRWKPVDMEYNVQGMGTYAELRTHSDHNRCALYTPEVWQRIQQDAKIIHFTGRAFPSLADYLCRYVRSPSKPWSWFCHHPLAEEYMKVLAVTPFACSKKRVVDEFADAIRETVAEAAQQLNLSPADCNMAMQQAMGIATQRR